MKLKLLLPICVVLSWMLGTGASAQTDSSVTALAPQPEPASVTHWSTNFKFFWSQESDNWDKNSFDDAVLDTSTLIISRSAIYESIALSTSYSTRGFENEWNIALGKLTKEDDLVVLDLGIGALFGAIPKTEISNQLAPISYYSTLSGHPLKQGTATYTYSIQGSYVGATVPLVLEWRYGMKPISLNGRVGILYRIASVTAERRLSAYDFPQDYDVPSNEGRFAFFNDENLTEDFDRKSSELVIAALPTIGISVRLPLSSQGGNNDGFGIIVGADFGAATRLYVAFSY